MAGDAARLQTEVERIALPQGRRVGSPGHAIVRDYLADRLRQIGLEPYAGSTYLLAYRSAGQDFDNVVGVVPGRSRDLPALLIGAHYDSVLDGHCADDNAAAVAIALSAAEVLVAEPLQRDVIVALFDAEEPPYFLSQSMGSTRFYTDQRSGAIHAGLIMDLVGHDVALSDQLGKPAREVKEILFVTGVESHARLTEVLEGVARAAPLPIVAALSRYVAGIAMSDYHVLQMYDVPYFFLTCGIEPRRYHRVTDTPDWLNYEKMVRIRNVLVDMTRRLDLADLSDAADAAQRRQSADPSLALEIALLRAVLGPQLDQLLPACGLSRLASRSDVDRLAALLGGLLRT
jgi:hypothetical protein